MEEKLNNRTCGECKSYLAKMFHCRKHDVMAESHQTCEDFEPKKKQTNGDRIRAMSDEELAKLFVYWDEDFLSYESTILETESFGFDEAKAIEATIKELKKEANNE